MRKKHLFYAISLISALFITISSFVDRSIMDGIDDPFLFTCATFLVATLVVVFLSALFSLSVKGKPLGQFIDPSFSRLRFIKKEEVKYHLLSGLGNAMTTVAYAYLLLLFLDPSTVLPFSQVVILYLLAIEVISEKNAPTLAELQSCIIITFGAIMASLSLGEINLWGLAIVFLVMNPAFALFSIYQRKLKSLRIGDSTNDSINIRLWNLVFTSAIAIVMVLFMRLDRISELAPLIADNFWPLSMASLAASISVILYVRGLGMAKASVAQAVRSTSLIFAIAISIMLSQLGGDPTFMMIKFMGVVLVILGVISFALTEVKAFLLVRAERGFSSRGIMERIWEIKGVDSVAMTAGDYDLVARVRTRTLGKGYERIVNEMEKIEGVEDFEWNSVLKEWEKV